MMDHREDEDRRLTRLLAAVRGDADPALWTRVRARILARERERAPAWLAWVMRPATLGVSLALFVAASALALALVASDSASLPLGSADNLPDALVAEVDAATAAAGNGASHGAPVDSGVAQ